MNGEAQKKKNSVIQKAYKQSSKVFIFSLREVFQTHIEIFILSPTNLNI
jgi:hypothetical protein